MKKCAYCGRENLDDATHCSECGTAEFAAPKPPVLPVASRAKMLTDTVGSNAFTRSERVWDFAFGVALIAGTPIVVYWSICLVAAWVFNPSSNLLLLGLVSQGALAAALTALVCACLWRSKHRLLSRSMFVVEVVVAILIGGMYFLVLAAAGYAAYRAD